MGQAFTCCYCVDPAAEPSRAHLFTDAIGGITAVDNTVCRRCNNDVNTKVENPAVRLLAYFRSALGIESRRGEIPHVDAFVETKGHQIPIRVPPGGDVPRHGIVRKVPGTKGDIVVMGEGAWVAEQHRKLQASHPGKKWEEIPVPEEFTVQFEDHPDRPEWRRLAAKVAYERFAQLRGSHTAKEPGFEAVRRFILDGADSRAVCGLICDPDWISGGGGLDFPVPHHAVAISVTPRNQFVYRVDAAVSLFGLYNFWVSLSSTYSGVAAWDDLLLEHPQTGEVQNPALRHKPGVPVLPWDRWAWRSVHEPDQVRAAAKEYMFRRFERAVETAYGPDRDADAAV